jgi:two-component system cell cycle response regulator DivK
MSKRILIVEDQEDLRGVLRDLVSGTGYTVIEAADGEAGIAKAKSEHRPRSHGHPDARNRRLRGYPADQTDPSLKSIPIVAVSSYAMKGDEEKARQQAATTTSRSLTAPSICCE